MESIRGSIDQAYLCGRPWTTLIYVLFLVSAGHLTSPSWAQAECGVIRATTTLRVQNQTGLDVLREAANCTDGGSLKADWAGAITLDSPIVVASGLFLSVSGEGALAEAIGGPQTRMFSVSRGAGLTLTKLKLSGGTERSGGAVYSNSATLILDRCIFHGNEATNGDGGAVWADGGNVTIIGGEFMSNNASGHGGAVATTGAGLVVKEGSMFEGNVAREGGALYCSGVAQSGLSGLATPCSLSDTKFTSNIATYEGEDPRGFVFSDGIHGGGAVAFLFATADVTDSVFGYNYAYHSGGALFGGDGTNITVDGCNFENNTVVMYGGAIAAASMTLGGATELSNNTADTSGGAVLGWDPSGTIVFNDVGCSQNVALDYGGCFYSAGRGIVNDGTVMHGNEADDGGCICAFGAEIEVFGGDFMCRSTGEGGFLNAKSSSSVKITGGLIAGNVAETRGGAIHCGEMEGSTLTIEGGAFTNNLAWESGGAVAARDSLSAVEITGGTFYNNTAKLYGGFVYVDEGASLNCQAITARGNKAGDQGGGIYARDATSMNSSCHLIGNESPQGAALHLTGSSGVILQNHTVTDNVASSGSVLYMTESSVVAIGVSFTSSVALQEDSSNRAVQSDGSSTLTAQECLFDGWIGDTVIYHRSPNSDSLILDSCDFSGSSAMAAVFSLNSDAKIRNAVVSDRTFANAGALSNSLALVNRVVDCSDATVCGIGDCVNSTLGVLCECLDDDSCLDDGSEVSLGVKTYPASETYSPGTVSFELVVSSAGGGTTHTIWKLEYEADDLVLDVAPSSGVLPPGDNLTVVVTGTPKGQDVGGDLVSRFNLTSVGNAGSTSTATVLLEVMSTFYLCSAFEYAVPLANETNSVSCEQCISINGGEGVDCKRPGATLASLPIRQGHWRSSRDSQVVHECLHTKACAGRTKLLSADDYCHAGYKGPYCAVCSDGYGRGVSNTCHFCDSTKGHVLVGAGALAAAVIFLVVLLAIVFLVGGLNAVDIVYQSVTRNGSKAGKASKVGSVSKSRSRGSRYPTRDLGVDYTSGTIAPALDFDWELERGASECHTRNGSMASTISNRAPTFVEQGARIRPPDAAVGVGTSVQLSDPTGGRNDHAGTSGIDRSWMSTRVEAGADRVEIVSKAGLETNAGGNPKSRGLGVRIKWWALGLPLYKFKILVVVWQILSGISSITGVEFPASYSTFLSWINVVNLDIGQLFSVSCVLPAVNFYARLLTTTLTPLVLAAVLLLTYQIAKYGADIGSAGVMAKKAAWSRHVAAGLLLTFLVFTPASTLVFETFDCDDAVGGEETYLRADYSLSCDTNLHMWFTGYAMIMVLVYPIGIPALYAAILWKQRELLNPRIHAATQSGPGIAGGAAATTDSKNGAGIHISMFSSTSKDQAKDTLSRQDLQEYHHRVRDRREHPELAPSMFLWKDFGPGLFYYEVIECGRRMLLTGVLIFVAPHSSTQAATACIFAFVGLLGFELLRPHLDLTDAWLYRLGCVVIFMSNFLGLLIKVDAAGVESRSALGGLLVAVNVLLVFAVLVTAMVDAKQSIGDSGDDDGAYAIARTMLTAGQDQRNTIQVTRQGTATISAGRPSTITSITPRGPPVI